MILARHVKIFIIPVIAVLIIGIGFRFYEYRKTENVEQNKFTDNSLEQSREAKTTIPKIDENDHLLGSSDAPIKIIFYGNFVDPFSRDFSEILSKVRTEFDNVAIVFRHYSISPRDLSIQASEASECAGAQGKFWEMYNELFSTQLGEEEIYGQLAKKIGVGEADFQECLSSEEFRNKILEESREAYDADVYGTPTTFINGKLVVGARPFADYTDEEGNTVEGMESTIRRELSNLQ